MIKVIKFYGPTCPACEIVEKNIKPIKEEFTGKVNFKNIEANAENAELFSFYNVRSIPVVVLENEEGEVDRWVGSFPANLLKNKIEELLNA